MARLIGGWHVRGVEKQKEYTSERERGCIKILIHPLSLSEVYSFCFSTPLTCQPPINRAINFITNGGIKGSQV